MKRYKNFLFLLYLITLIFGCQSDDQASSMLPETAVPITRPSETATPIPTPTDPPIQPTEPPPPTMTATPQSTSTPLPTPTPTTAPVNWSAVQNGATIFYYYDRDLWRSSIDGSIQEPLTEGDMLAPWDLESTEDKWYSGGTMPRPFVSPDGHYIAFTLTGGGVVVIDVSNPSQPRTLAGGSILMAWSPDSRYLAYGRSALYLYDTITNQATEIAANESSSALDHITWSPNGRYIGFSCCFSEREGEEYPLYGDIRQYDTETAQTDTVGEVVRGIAGGTSAICWQEDMFVPRTGSGQLNCTDPGSFSLFTSESPDGEKDARILYTQPDDPLHNRQVNVLDIETETILLQIMLENTVNKIAWSADGRYILINNYYPGLSPIWRLLADGTSSPELIIEEAFLIDVVPMWQD